LKTPSAQRIWRYAREDETMANPLQFIQQTRAEIAKVVWPTRREVGLTTLMVFIMATLTAVFFFLVDLAIRSGLQAILTFFG
jgi:preprotein translocase subunit SecE